MFAELEAVVVVVVLLRLVCVDRCRVVDEWGTVVELPGLVPEGALRRLGIAASDSEVCL